MIDFNGAPEQKEMASGPIPPKSMVKVRLAIRTPSEKKKSDLHPLLCKSDKNNHFLDVEYEVVAGRFQGLKIWQNYVVQGSEKATNISMAFFRAAIEAARGIDPKDNSPQATQGRQLNDWGDFSGAEFPVVVGVQKPKVGDQYINNNVLRAITPDKAEYQQIMNGGEFITEEPIPQIPAATPTAQTNGQGWGQPAGQPANTATPQSNGAQAGWVPQTQGPMPGWAAGPPPSQ